MFFFKQKTAYEMRISDWSSDVCSSDLPVRPAAGPARFRPRPRRAQADAGHAADGAGDGRFAFRRLRAVHRTRLGRIAGRQDRSRQTRLARGQRSEEHTSELQSLMRISYAVFCLTKKTKETKNTLLNYKPIHQ